MALPLLPPLPTHDLRIDASFSDSGSGDEDDKYLFHDDDAGTGTTAAGAQVAPPVLNYDDAYGGIGTTEADSNIAADVLPPPTARHPPPPVVARDYSIPVPRRPPPPLPPPSDSDDDDEMDYDNVTHHHDPIQPELEQQQHYQHTFPPESKYVEVDDSDSAASHTPPPPPLRPLSRAPPTRPIPAPPPTSVPSSPNDVDKPPPAPAAPTQTTPPPRQVLAQVPVSESEVAQRAQVTRPAPPPATPPQAAAPAAAVALSSPPPAPSSPAAVTAAADTAKLAPAPPRVRPPVPVSHLAPSPSATRRDLGVGGGGLGLVPGSPSSTTSPRSPSTGNGTTSPLSIHTGSQALSGTAGGGGLQVAAGDQDHPLPPTPHTPSPAPSSTGAVVTATGSTQDGVGQNTRSAARGAAPSVAAVPSASHNLGSRSASVSPEPPRPRSSSLAMSSRSKSTSSSHAPSPSPRPQHDKNQKHQPAPPPSTTHNNSHSPAIPSWRTMAEHQYFIPAAIVTLFLVIYGLGPRLFFTLAALVAAPFIARYILPPTKQPPRAEIPLRGFDAGDTSVGWVNHALRALFPLISTDVLTPFIDLLEDALIQQVPPIVTSVRVSSVSLGVEPIVLTSLRVISDAEWFHALGDQVTGKPLPSTPDFSSCPNANRNSFGAVPPSSFKQFSDQPSATPFGQRRASETTLSLRRRPSMIQSQPSLSPGSLAVPLSPSPFPTSPTASSFGSPSSVPAPVITPVTSPSKASTRHSRSVSNASRLSFLSAPDRVFGSGGKTAKDNKDKAKDNDRHPPSPVIEGPARAQTMRKRDRLLARLRNTKGRGQTAAVYGAPDINVSGEPAAYDDDQDNEADPSEKDPDTPQYVNYECGFVYNHTAEMKKRGSGLHMITHFGVGVKGLGDSEWPVFLDVTQLSGVVRLRLLLGASPPFVREATFSFVRMPTFNISARPLGAGAFNAMDVPLVKSYVEKSIAKVAATFVAPKSFTMDVDRLLLGHENSLRTHSIGVLRLKLHGATGLPRTDTVGSCDPYLVASYSKFNKPLFSTRTIVDTLDPIWDESAYILVPADAVAAGEALRLRVCDSDRFSADDAIGIIDVDVYDLIGQSAKHPGNELIHRVDALKPERPGLKCQGEVEWSVRFSPLYHMPREEVQRRLNEVRDKRGEGYPPTPRWMEMLNQWLSVPEWETERAERRKDTADLFTGERARDEMEAYGKPTGERCSGVLQFHIHQCADLELESLAGTFSASSMSRRKSAASGKPALEDIVNRAPADNESPPSAYVEVHLNDRYIYRTRTKQLTPMPYFNAVSERFIGDWRMAKITFVVRDDRNREHDPILGLVSLRLRDALKDTSQFTRWFPLVGGLGWGRIRLSLLFKPFDIKLPAGISTYETATLDIKAVNATNLVELCGGKQPSILIETEHDRAILHGMDDEAAAAGADSEAADAAARSSGASGDGGHSRERSATSTTSSRNRADMHWTISQSVRLAVKYRYSCNVLFSFLQRRTIKKPKVHGLATLRLDDCPDGQEITRRLPIYGTSSVRDAMKAARMYENMGSGDPRQSNGSALTAATGGTNGKNGNGKNGNGNGNSNGNSNGNTGPPAKIVGFITVTFVLHPGLSHAHHKLTRRDLKFKAVYEAWEATRLVEDTGRPGAAGLVVGASDSESDSGGERANHDDEYDALWSDDEDVDPAYAAAERRKREAQRRSGSAAQLAMHEDDTESILAEGKGKALAKGNRGIFQLKLARTGKFIKDKAEAKLLSSSVGDKVHSRPHGGDFEVEYEGTSRLG